MNPVQLAEYSLWLVSGQTEQRINDVAERFQGGGAQISTTHFVVFCVVAVILGVVLWWVARAVALRDGRSYFSTKRLFYELCRLHELDLSSRRLLRRLAQARQLKHPSQLFLEPTWFEPAEIPAALRPFQPQLAEIKQQLFESERRSSDGLS